MPDLSDTATTVNTVPALGQGGGEAVTLADGGYLLAWTAQIAGPDGDPGALSASQRFDASGRALGEESLAPPLPSAQAAALAGGGWLLLSAASGGLQVELHGADGATAGAFVAASAPAPSGGYAYSLGQADAAGLADGGFVLVWTQSRQAPFAGGHLGPPPPAPYQVEMAERFDASGRPVAPAFALTAESQAGTRASAAAALADGGFALAWDQGGVVMEQLYDASGAPRGGAVALGAYDLPAGEGLRLGLAGLADGSSVAVWSAGAAPHGDIGYAHVSATGHAGPAHAIPGQTGAGQAAVAALPDGGYVLAWIQENADLSETVMAEQFGAADQPVGGPVALSGDEPLILSPTVAVNASGQALVAWSENPSLTQGSTQSQERAVLVGYDGAAVPAFAGEQLVAAGDAVALTGSAGWTSAAVTSDHHLAVVAVQDGGWGSHVATAQTYDGSGVQTGSAALLGYAGLGQTLSPAVSASPVGGFYTVSYAGSGDYEVHAASGQRVFAHNAYTGASGLFAPLLDGRYVVADGSAGVYGLFDAQGENVVWSALPAGALNAAAPLWSGGFALTYAGSQRIDFVGWDGQAAGLGHLGASASDFAMTLALRPASNTFGAVWLSPDGGQDGLATSIQFQMFWEGGQPIGGPVTVAQDLDPWHTAFRLQMHEDGSAAILWSQGGAVFGAEYADGAVGPAHGAVVGDLSSVVAIELTGDKAGLAWLEGGHAWAEIFDPASGAVHRADLGAAAGDLSTLHALAAVNGGMAVSWRGADGDVQAAMLSDAGALGPAVALPGDLLGVDTLGRALTLHDQGGTPVLQAYAINDTLFWVH